MPFRKSTLWVFHNQLQKWAYQVRRAEIFLWAIARAFYIAKSGRPGPVVIDLTKNAQVQEFDF
jgi:acetolactate synthase-1/2/3 large subunit